jgi:hypothetical protein
MRCPLRRTGRGPPILHLTTAITHYPSITPMWSHAATIIPLIYILLTLLIFRHRRALQRVFRVISLNDPPVTVLVEQHHRDLLIPL